MKTTILVGALACAVQPALADNINTYDLGSLVVTAQRFSAPQEKTPASITVITRDEIERSPAANIPDLIARQAGVNLQDLYGNNASNSTLDLRGFGATGKQNTLILLDGKKISDIDLTSVQWAGIPLDAIERIEIVRGSGAVLYGEGATSGVINLITRKPMLKGAKVNVAYSLGSFDTQEARANLAYRGDRVWFNLAASEFSSDGYRKNNKNQQTNLFSTLNWDSPIGEFALHLATDRQDLRLPGARRIQPSSGLNEYVSDIRGAQTPLDYSSRDGNNFALGWNRKFSLAEVSSDISLRTKEQKSYFDQSGFPDYRVIELSVLGITPRVKIDFSQNNNLILGVDFYHWKYDLKKSNAPANISQPINHVTATEDTMGIYALETLSLGKNTTLTIGARTESLKISSRDTYDPNAPGSGGSSGAPAGGQSEHEYAYELGLRQRLGPMFSGFAKIGRNYRFANVDEIYESDATFNNGFQFLRPQSARERQLGVDFKQGTSNAKLALFHMDVKDEIHLDPFTTGVGNTNLPPSRRYGFELEGSFKPADAWRLDANYSYTKAKFLSGVLPGGGSTRTNVNITGKSVPLVPNHKVNLGAQWAPSKHTTVALSATHTSKQFMENDEPNDLGVMIPAYTLMDLKITQKIGELKAALAVNNLLGEKYYTYAVRSQFTLDRYSVYPLPGRTFTASLEYAF